MFHVSKVSNRALKLIKEKNIVISAKKNYFFPCSIAKGQLENNWINLNQD